MAEVLSQSEIEQLLAAINAEDNKPEDSKPANSSRKIKIYDFKRSNKFFKEQIQAMSIAHEAFALLASINLTAKLHRIVKINVASVDQLTYDEFFRSIPTYSTLSVISLEPLNGSIVLEIDPEISFSAFDILLGGFGNKCKNQYLSTHIEKSVIKRIINRIIDDLKETWAKAIDLQPQLVKIETNPQFVQIVQPTEMVLLVTLEAKVGDVEGMINIAYPYPFMNEMLDKLTSAYSHTVKATPIKNYTLLNRDNIPVRMTAELFNRNFPISEIVEWKKETVILPLRKIDSNNCYLRINDRRVWQCEILKDDRTPRVLQLLPKKIKINEMIKNPFGTEGKNMEPDKNNQVVTDALAKVEVKITVELGSTYKPLKEVFGMDEGSIIELDKLAGEPLDVTANGVLIAKAEVVVIDENFGVRITEILGSSNKD